MITVIASPEKNTQHFAFLSTKRHPTAMTSGHVLRMSKKKLGAVATLALGATYWYYKPISSNPPPKIPYIPPPFVWESIPKPILKRFTLPITHREGIVWNAFSTAVMGGAGTLAKGFLKLSQTQVHGLEKFVQIVEDPDRKKGLITGKYTKKKKSW
jgi:hypothetical protein